ncbi:MAG: 2-polyprenylphenol 6-hydroxylase [Deltaproteobacteria bacterium]|nr:2-polyprenylphenol 6-hydroxylase [Deltaproteobacteria bacterium]
MNNSTYKNIRRLNEIVVTLIRYGFGGLAAELHIFPRFFSSIERIFVSRKKTEDFSTPERIRMVLEELGPTFIKLGQIASTRADLLPPEWINEFKKLQDMVTPVPFEEIKKVVETSLKGPLSSKFQSFNETPVASASIAQVHFAELRDGTKVAVKVKRPGIDRIIESDMSVMNTLAGLLDKYVPASRRYRPKEVVAEFERVIKNEQDLSIEGVNINRFYTMFKGDQTVQIPYVYWDYTSEEVLTMERISGTPIDEVETLKAKGLDVKPIAIRGIELFFRQVFEFGIFHADLHPGNIFVRDDGVIIYLDFGIVGRIDKDLRKYLASMLFYLVRGDYTRMAAVHREMGLIGDGVSLHEFEEALRDISEPIFGRTLEQINISGLLMKLIQTARRFDMTLQPNLLLLQKSMVIIEGVGRQLYPDVNMWEVAKPLIYKWVVKEKFSPKSVIEKGRDSFEELAGAALEVPIQINTILRRALKEELKIGFVHHRLETVTDELKTAGKRIGGGIIIASLVIGASMVAVYSGGDAATFLGLPVLSDIGFVLAVILGYRLFSDKK